MDYILNVWKLSPNDQQLAKEMVEQRIAKSKTIKTGDPYFNDRMDDIDQWLNSSGAEVAYARLVGGDMAPEAAPWDVVVDSHKVDVKWSAYDDGVLLVKSKGWQNGRPDWFAMMIGQFPVFEYRGRIAADVILSRPVTDDPKFVKPGLKPGHVAEQYELDRRLSFDDQS